MLILNYADQEYYGVECSIRSLLTLWENLSPSAKGEHCTSWGRTRISLRALKARNGDSRSEIIGNQGSASIITRLQCSGT